MYAGHNQFTGDNFSRKVFGLTSSNSVHLVLDKEIYQRDQSSKESSSQPLPVLDGSWIWRAQNQAADSPRQSRHQIADHEYIVPIMVIRARDICPPSTSDCPEDAHSRDKLRQSAARAVGEAVEEEDQHKTWSGADSDEDLEDGAFGISIANRCADGWEPFLRIAPVFVLHDLVVV